MSTSTCHSVSDIIDSHYQQQRQQTITQHVPSNLTDNICQSRVTDSRQPFAVTHHTVQPGPPTKSRPPPVVMVGDENDGNCLNLLRPTKPQYCTTSALRQYVRRTTADVHDQRLEEPANLAGHSAEFLEHRSAMLARADPVTVRGAVSELETDCGRQQRPEGREYDWVYLQHAGTLPQRAGTDTAVRQPLSQLYSTAASNYMPETRHCEHVTGRHSVLSVPADTVSTLHTAGRQSDTDTSARSHGFLYSTALETTGQFMNYISSL